MSVISFDSPKLVVVAGSCNAGKSCATRAILKAAFLQKPPAFRFGIIYRRAVLNILFRKVKRGNNDITIITRTQGDKRKEKQDLFHRLNTRF